MTENEILDEKISGQEGFMLRPQDWMKKQSKTTRHQEEEDKRMDQVSLV